ncbi:MAG: tRNA (N6-isopentenyl adenosine(37)-C2)-methylthiotransferase MiaB [Candidatus Margulisiibacteriota bacterium]
MTKTYYIRTFGCQMNKNDSEKIAGILESIGYQEAPDQHHASLILLNTCSIRGKAESRVYGWLGQLKKLKVESKELKVIGVCGCIPQHVKEDIFKKAPHVDLVFGANNIHHLPQLLARVEQGEKHVIEILENVNPVQTQGIASLYKNTQQPIKRSSTHQAWVSIMYGCDNFCSYCVVPYTRGREVSRTKEDIFAEINAIDKEQYSEIVLLGQNVNSYGKGLYQGTGIREQKVLSSGTQKPHYDFADLLNDVTNLPGVQKVGFMTSHPKDMSDKLIKTIADNPKISREIHVPVQTGDDEVLRNMNRKYTVADYRSLVNKIRKAIPEAEVSTDIIAGFPGETEEQFQNTLNLVREMKFTRVNTAAYSPRPLTKAADMPGHLPVKVRSERLQMLMKAVEESALL